jgi:hypothetical protein
LAIGWGFVPAAETEAAVALLRRIIAMLWKLNRR